MKGVGGRWRTCAAAADRQIAPSSTNCSSGSRASDPPGRSSLPRSSLCHLGTPDSSKLGRRGLGSYGSLLFGLCHQRSVSES